MNEEESATKKKYDYYLIILLIICISAFLIQAHFVSQIKFIGSSDPAFYAEVADNLIKGKGFVMDFINSYFVKFDSITHPEEYGFPGVSIILVPFILLFGKTAFAVKLPSMIAGVILFPILTYFLGKDFFNKRIGFLAAVSMIFYPTIFPISFGGERDVLYAFFLVAGIYFFYKGIKNERMNVASTNLPNLFEFLKENKYFLLMGAFLGYSYLIRQTTLAFIPVLIIIYYLLNKKFSKKFLFGLGVCVLVMAPWLIRNYLAFGDPFFTVNKYVGATVGFVAYSNEALFKIYWNLPKPNISYIIDYFGGPYEFLIAYARRLFSALAGQFTNFIIINLLAFVGIALTYNRKIVKKLQMWIVFLIILSIFVFFFIEFVQSVLIYSFLRSIPYLALILTSFFLFRKDNLENTFFILLLGGCALFFSVIWVFDIRYWIPMIPFLLIYSWYGLEKLLGKVIAQKEQLGKLLIIVLIIFILFALPNTFGKFLDKNTEFPFKDDSRSKDIMLLTDKMNSLTEKDAIIMGCDIGVFHFYTDRKYVAFPSDNKEAISYLMRYYNVSYFTLQTCERRGIDVGFYADLFDNATISTKELTQGRISEVVVTKRNGRMLTYKIKIPTILLRGSLYKISYTNGSTIELTQV